MYYKIEHQISTLIHNAVMDNKNHPASFTVQDMTFSHWDFNDRDGWRQDLWLVEGKIEALNGVDAINQFREKLKKIIPRIALIGQCYINFTTEPWLVKKHGSDIILYRHAEDRIGTGLMFREEEKKALELLLDRKDIPESFYCYWHDAVNSTGYSSKLLLMFSAIESLVKGSSKKKDWEKVKKILGEDLTKDLFGTKEESEFGLRHRLIHGEYFSSEDCGKNYLDLVHKRVLLYFNKKVLKENLLELNVRHPQRHFFGNKKSAFIFIRIKAGFNVDLKSLISSISEDMTKNTDSYDFIFEKEVKEKF